MRILLFKRIHSQSIVSIEYKVSVHTQRTVNLQVAPALRGGKKEWAKGLTTRAFSRTFAAALNSRAEAFYGSEMLERGNYGSIRSSGNRW